MLRVDDVEVACGQEAGYSVYDTGSVGTGEREDVFISVGHFDGVGERGEYRGVVCVGCEALRFGFEFFW